MFAKVKKRRDMLPKLLSEMEISSHKDGDEHGYAQIFIDFCKDNSNHAEETKTLIDSKVNL